MKGPRLPERVRSGSAKACEGTAQPNLQTLQQQLNTNPAFKQFVDQPEKLLAVLQSDQVLADAARGNPEIAALLDPSTLKQALSVLQGTTCDQQQQGVASGAPPAVQRKALMQLQNYAMQLHQARAAGVNTAQQQQVHLNLSMEPTAGPPVAGNDMWSAMQQRFSKYQERSSVLATLPSGSGVPELLPVHTHSVTDIPQQPAQHSPVVPTQPQQLREQSGSSQLTAAAHHQQHHELAAAAAPRLQSKRLAEVAGWSAGLHSSSGSSIHSPGATPKAPRLAHLTMPDGLGSQVMSPLARVNSPGSGAASSSSQCFSPAAAPFGALQRRSSSSLSHRLLRHTAASPLDLTDLQRSGSHALNIERLESGDVIVDITPPTRVTQDLSWSTDPSAVYVQDAAASGSFSQLPCADSNSQLPVSTTATAAASEGDVEAAAAAAAAVHASPFDAAAAAAAAELSQHTGLLDSDTSSDWRSALPAAAAATGTADTEIVPVAVNASSYDDISSTPADSVGRQGMSDAAAAATAAAVAAASPGVSSTKLQPSPAPTKPQLRVASTGSARQAQRQQQEHYSYVDLSDNAAKSTGTSSASAQPQQQQQSGIELSGAMAGGLYGNMPTDQSRTAEQVAGAATASAAAGGGAGRALDARTYYESVPPSTWRPTDVGGAPGDYLELYRRAYCSYADALFPPVWMALVLVLCTLRLLPLWQLCIVGALSFWGGLWLLAIKWAGVPPAQLGLSRVTPVLTVCLELLCTGAFLTQVLPVMWLGHSFACALLLMSSVAMMALHLTAYLQDPGYTPLPDAEEGLYARHLAATSPRRTNTHGPATAESEGNTAAAASSTHTADSDRSSRNRPSEQMPLLGNTQQQQQQQQGTRGGAGPMPWTSQPMDHCWTCRVKRNLRSKHCPLCRRCVERFDHHCPVLGNCVGAGNHKTFVTFLATMLLSQFLFCHLVSSMLVQLYLLQVPVPHSTGMLQPGNNIEAGPGSGITVVTQHGGGQAALHAATAAGSVGTADPLTHVAAGRSSTSSTGADSGVQAGQQQTSAPAPVAAAGVHRGGSQDGWWLTVQALWVAGSTQMGLVLLLMAQVPTMLMSGYLLFRALALAAANLTVNEWMNRQRYVHLHYTGAGFSNRFDRGVASNCYEFWCGPKYVDYWEAWDAAEQEMQDKGVTVLVPWSASVFVRFCDLRWSQYQQRLVSSRERRKEVQVQRRMRALGLTQQH